MTTKLCYTCNLYKELSFFVKSTTIKDGYRSLCKECRNLYYKKRRKEQPELVRSYEYKRKRDRALRYYFGLTELEYLNKLEIQNYVCAICKSKEIQIDKRTKLPRNLAVDHCHKTDKVRGLLCSKCNIGLGMFHDNTELLIKAVDYLNQYND